MDCLFLGASQYQARTLSMEERLITKMDAFAKKLGTFRGKYLYRAVLEKWTWATPCIAQNCAVAGFRNARSKRVAVIHKSCYTDGNENQKV